MADGSKQRLWINNEEASSPTVAVESVILSEIIDAKEQREVAVVDIPIMIAFIQTNNEKLKSHHETDIMKAKGSLADMLVEIDPDTHRPHLTKNDKKNGATALHSKILKALHGMIVSSLLFCRKLRKDLEQ